tara:strand:+ start:532 stop:738 length:207 start_codon:yes stop_codon:yes gene_type:complete
MKFIAILFGIILLMVIIWLYMQDRILKEDDNPMITKLEKQLSSEKGKNFMGLVAVIGVICMIILTFLN